MSSVMERTYCGKCKKIFYGVQAARLRPKVGEPKMPRHQIIDQGTQQKTGKWCDATLDDIVHERIPPAPPEPCVVCDEPMHAHSFGTNEDRSFGSIRYAHGLIDLGRGVLIPSVMGGDNRSAGVICPDCMDEIKAKRAKVVT